MHVKVIMQAPVRLLHLFYRIICTPDKLQLSPIARPYTLAAGRLLTRRAACPGG